MFIRCICFRTGRHPVARGEPSDGLIDLKNLPPLFVTANCARSVNIYAIRLSIHQLHYQSTYVLGGFSLFFQFARRRPFCFASDRTGRHINYCDCGGRLFNLKVKYRRSRYISIYVRIGARNVE